MINDLQLSPLATTIDYYARCINDKARAFLNKHALCDDAILRVGFADRTLGKQLPAPRLKAGREIRAHLKRAEVLKPNGRELFRGHVTVPLTSIKGETTGIYGLRLDVLPGQQRETIIGGGLFNAAALQSFDEIIVCGSVIDAWTFYAAGHKNVIAAEGVELQHEHFANVKRVLLADATIDGAAFAGLELMRINFPEGTSVNQYAIDSASMDEAIGKRIRAASWIGGTASQPVGSEAAKKETTTKNTERHEAPQASPVPAVVDDLEADSDEHQTVITIENRRWRIRGLERNSTIGVLKVNVMVLNDRNNRFHVDALDLYQARARRVFLREAADEIAESENELRSDLGRVLLKLEQLQLEQLGKDKPETKTVELSDTERAAAMELLKDERLLDRILDDFDACGIVGERIGKLTGYIAATSRLLPKPLGVVIQSSSAAGKTSLLDAILAFMPEEQQFGCSAMTSRSLYYAGNLDLRHKILSIAEEEGVRDASYALKLLQSEGKLSIVTTAKESGSGRTVVERYDVKGPVATLMTTTASDVDPELMNRCFVLGVDENPEQTQLIQQRQREAETIEAMLDAEDADGIRRLHQNAQRLLRPVRISNPYASQLRFTGQRVRNRRDQAKYLGLIRAIAFLHQHQREVKAKTRKGRTIEYIEITKRDIALANMIADAVLGTSIDELPQQTRKLLRDLHGYVRRQAETNDLHESEICFTRRQIREQLGWGATQLRVHLERLCRWEYVVAHGSGRGKLTEYELLYDGRGYEGQPTVCGLIDPATLSEPDCTTTNLAGPKGNVASP